MPLFLTLPDSLIKILERRNRRIQPELILVRIIPLINRSTRRSRAVLQVGAQRFFLIVKESRSFGP
jgi:hypothetical protein